MEIQFINQFLKLLKEALEWLQKLYETARQGGLPPFDLMPLKTAMELTTAHSNICDDEAIRLAYRRMLGRNRQRRYRQRHRQAREVYKTVTGDAKSVTGNVSVTDCNALAKKEKENEKRKNQRKEINKNKKIIKSSIADAMPNSAREQKEAENGMENETDSRPPTKTEEKTSRLILTRDLPKKYQNIVRAWNSLPLPKKLRGLYPTMVRRLNQLFEDYGEDAVHEAIDRVADTFLLGKTKNNRGWVANLYWLLQPDNLEKVLSGQYQDDASPKWFDEATPTVPEGFCGTVVY